MLAEFTRVLVVDMERQRALMFLDEEWDEWDLPYFMCERLLADNYLPYVSVLCEELGLDTKQSVFTGMVDLLGDYSASERGEGVNRLGYARLLLVNTHDYSFKLPERWEWKDVQFLESLRESDECDDCGLEASMQLAMSVLNKSKATMDLLWEPRHQFGWHSKASRWLCQVVEEQGAEVTGPVVQHMFTSWRIILRVETNQGLFFLKSSAAGTPETQVTQAICEALPDMTLHVVGVSETLASFITREIEVAINREIEDVHELRSMMTRKIGSFQLASIKHKDVLMEAGCPVLEPCNVLRVLEEMQQDECLQESVPGLLRAAKRFEPQIKSIISRLVEGRYKIPLTVIHGDLGIRNLGFKKDEGGTGQMILFDWQYTVISHPFFDFHELRRRLDEGQIEEYLEMWSEYEPIERCWEAFELAFPLGWIIKIYTSLNCLRASTLNFLRLTPRQTPVMVSYLTEFWDRMEFTMEEPAAYIEPEREKDAEEKDAEESCENLPCSPNRDVNLFKPQRYRKRDVRWF